MLISKKAAVFQIFHSRTLKLMEKQSQDPYCLSLYSVLMVFYNLGLERQKICIYVHSLPSYTNNTQGYIM